MKKQDKPRQIAGPQANRIPLPFDKAVEGLLAVKPKKANRPKPKKKSRKK